MSRPHSPIELKLYCQGDDLPSLREFVPIFHRWIQNRRSSEELLIDVADYSHVARGPGVLLIGEDTRYGIDETDGQLGLTTRRGRAGGEAPGSRFHVLLARSLRAACRLVEEPELAGVLRFRNDEMRLRIHDRLVALEDDGALERAAGELRTLLGCAESGARLELETPPKEPWTSRLVLEPGLDFRSALSRLGETLPGGVDRSRRASANSTPPAPG